MLFQSLFTQKLISCCFTLNFYLCEIYVDDLPFSSEFFVFFCHISRFHSLRPLFRHSFFPSLFFYFTSLSPFTTLPPHPFSFLSLICCLVLAFALIVFLSKLEDFDRVYTSVVYTCFKNILHFQILQF